MRLILLFALLLPLSCLSQSWWLVLEDINNDGIRDSCVMTRLDTARMALSLRQEKDSLFTRSQLEASYWRGAYQDTQGALEKAKEGSVLLTHQNLTLQDSLTQQVQNNLKRDLKIRHKNTELWLWRGAGAVVAYFVIRSVANSIADP